MHSEARFMGFKKSKLTVLSRPDGVRRSLFQDSGRIQERQANEQLSLRLSVGFLPRSAETDSLAFQLRLDVVDVYLRSSDALLERDGGGDAGPLP